MNQWQPISTAPKDGTPILVWCKGYMRVARYFNGFLHPQSNSKRYLMNATHWKPLPEPPKET